MSDKRLFKLQIMISDSELEAIDDYRFETRAESRASAVRELMRAALRDWREKDGAELEED